MLHLWKCSRPAWTAEHVSNLVWWNVSLPVAGGLELDDLSLNPFQPRAFYNFVKWCWDNVKIPVFQAVQIFKNPARVWCFTPKLNTRKAWIRGQHLHEHLLRMLPMKIHKQQILATTNALRKNNLRDTQVIHFRIIVQLNTMGLRRGEHVLWFHAMFVIMYLAYFFLNMIFATLVLYVCDISYFV